MTPFDSHLKRPSKSTAPRPLQAAVVLSVLYLLARLTGLLQSILISTLLETKARDAYAAAFDLPDMMNYLVAGGAMSITFIPVFTELIQTGREREAWRFFSGLATLMGCVLLVLTLFGVLAADPLMRLTKPGLAHDPAKFSTLQLAITMTQVVLPAQIFFYLGGMVVGVLNANKRFAASGWTGAVYNIVAIAVGVVLLRFVGPVAFAWGILIGAIAGNFVLPLWAALSGPPEQRLQYLAEPPHTAWTQPAIRRFFLNALPIMLGVSLPVVDQVVVGWFASYLHPGALWNLRNGNRVMLAPLGIVAQAASVAAFPYMASEAAGQDWRKFAGFLRSGLGRLMFLTLPLSVLLILIGEPLINLLFAYGKYNEPVALHETTVAFQFYCVGLFAWGGQQFVARGFYALQDTWTPTVIGSILTIFFFIPLSWAAAQLDGVRGLAFATSIGATAHFCGILIALEAKLRRRRYNIALGTPRIMGTLLRTVVACVPMGLAGLVTNAVAVRHLADDKLGDVMRLVCVGLVASLAFALAAQLFAIPDWSWLKAKLLRRRAAR